MPASKDGPSLLAELDVRTGPLHAAAAEGILRPVSSDLAAVTGAGREVELRMGPGARERLEKLSGLPVGGAVVTPGGGLAASFLIHVVVQSNDEPVTQVGVRKAVLNGLRRASEWEMETLALPPIGTGAGNLDAEAAARVMLPVMVEHFRVHALPEIVTVVVEGAYEDEVFRRAVATAGRRS